MREGRLAVLAVGLEAVCLVHVEQERLERRPGIFRHRRREQLPVAAELEGHGARHDPLRAPHHLRELRGVGRRVRDRGGALRRVAEQHAF